MISIVIPVFNEEKALPNTLRALFAQPGDYETLVIDGSSDRTRAIVESFGFTDGAGDRRCSSLESRRSSCELRFTSDASRRVLTDPKGSASQMNAGENRPQALLSDRSEARIRPRKSE